VAGSRVGNAALRASEAAQCVFRACGPGRRSRPAARGACGAGGSPARIDAPARGWGLGRPGRFALAFGPVAAERPVLAGLVRSCSSSCSWRCCCWLAPGAVAMFCRIPLACRPDLEVGRLDLQARNVPGGLVCRTGHVRAVSCSWLRSTPFAPPARRSIRPCRRRGLRGCRGSLSPSCCDRPPPEPRPATDRPSTNG